MTKHFLAKRPTLRIASVLLLGFVFAAVVLIPIGQARAAFVPNYIPSNLMDNPTFVNDQTMSPQVIQAFLSNVGSGLAGYTDVEACDATITAYYTHCGQTLSAAQIIYDASQAYSINPRVILATLEKEQSLVTDPTPSASQIDCAMGYHSCSGYVGFFTQVDNGTWTLAYNYQGALGTTNWLSWHPGTYYACATAKSAFYTAGLYPGNTVTFVNSGGLAQTITLANAATASLYCYTPYVGPYSLTGYSGSYNFVYYYQLWFGSTQATVAYAWNYQSATAYQNSAMTTALTGTTGSAPGGNTTYTVAPGADIYLQVIGRNVGYATWGQANLHLGTSNPDDRTSAFSNSGWYAANRPAALVESTVAPGATGTFDFPLQAPSQPGTYNEYFNVVDDGATWLNDPGMYFSINVVAPVSATNTQGTGLGVGQSINTTSHLLSPDTQSTLNLRSDGNLVLYSNYLPIWATNTSGTNADNLVMQSDGNLVLYNSSGAAVWASNTSGNPDATLKLQTDGNLVIYSTSGTALWNTSTVSVPNHLSRVTSYLQAQKLYTGQSVMTANRNYQLILQADGNLVLYYQGSAIWSSGTAGVADAYAAMQSDGNLVLYNTSGVAVWATNTSGNNGSSLLMQADGNLVLYNANWKAVWASNTSGFK